MRNVGEGRTTMRSEATRMWGEGDETLRTLYTNSPTLLGSLRSLSQVGVGGDL